MKINNINTDKKVFIIAEIGNNHEGSLSLAKKMIKAAKFSGADAVKFQTIIPKKLVEESDIIRIKQLKKFELSKANYVQLKKYCDNVGLIFLSTPFDLNSVNELKKLIPAFKISSGDNNYFELIDKVIETKKPIIISTGLNNNNEIKKLVNYFKKHNKFMTNLNESLTLLHCVSKYPTPLNEAFLENINFLKKLNCTVGYSDHTQGIDACLTAVVMGARVIEKHFTIDNNFSKFRDHQLSANPTEFKKMVSSIRNIEILISNRKYKLNENINVNLRRSARYTKNLKSGSFINEQNIKWVRPGNGIINSNKNKILGKKLKVSVLRDQLVELKHIN
tara:strand:+ start:1511 stop:2512 length:1002 start_codon:yes stop_codon:yes gene_type:complete